MAVLKKINCNKWWRQCGEKETPVCCWWDCKLVQPLWKTVWKLFKKLKLQLIYPMIQQSHLWVFIQRKLKHYVEEICETPCVHQCMNEEVMKLYTCTHNRIAFSHKKGNLPFATWMDLEGTMLSEISHTKSNTV